MLFNHNIDSAYSEWFEHKNKEKKMANDKCPAAYLFFSFTPNQCILIIK